MEIIKKAPDANKLSFGYQEPFIYLLNLWSDRCIHILSVQAVNNPVGQSDGRYNNSGSFYMSSYLEKYLCSRNNNIGPVRFQLILLDTLFGRELSMFHIYLAVIRWVGETLFCLSCPLNEITY